MKNTFKLIIALLIFSCQFSIINAQIAINSDGSAPDASAMLEITSTDKGILTPRLTTAQRTAISSPATGLLVYDIDENSFWYYANSTWLNLSNSILSDADADTKIQVEESTDEDIIRFDLAGTEFMRLDSGRIEILNTGNSIIIGEDAGINDDYSDNRNIFLGYQTGYSNTTGYYNVFSGSQAGYSNTEGDYNLFSGYRSGYSNSTGNYNVFSGYQAGYSNTTGNYNVSFGYEAGYSSEGNRNLSLGSRAGYSNVSGTKNVFVGNKAGYFETGSHKLYIESSDTDSPLIYGDFSTNNVVINGNASNNSNNRTLFVQGSIGATSAFNNDSDRRLKENINTIPNALDKVLQMRGVTYQWKDGRELGDRMGFIAQEVEPILPQVVDNRNDHYTMQYAPITAVLVEAVKEQQAEIDELKKAN